MSPRAAAIGLLARRDYTAHELRRKLIDRGHPEHSIDATLAQLRAEGFVNDQRVAASHVRTASAIKGRGRHRVARELEARGIAKTLIDDALAGLAAADESALIRRILTRKRWPARPTLADRRRMYQHLLRRGFPSDSIRRALGPGGWEPDDPAEE